MWTLDSANVVPCWKWNADSDRHTPGFSTRRGGVSRAPFESLNLGRSTVDAPDAVSENRRRLLAAYGHAPDRIATAGQVHGARIAEVEAPGHTAECDALLTRVPGLVLAVTTADCMPLIYCAPGVVAVAHSGWRGTADGMPGVALHAVCAAAGVEPRAVHVHLGPCIRACCYQVGSDVAQRFPPLTVQTTDGVLSLDLPHAARLQLAEAGVPAYQVHDTLACTACEPYWYFSHRRDGTPSGRQWAIVALDE